MLTSNQNSQVTVSQSQHLPVTDVLTEWERRVYTLTLTASRDLLVLPRSRQAMKLAVFRFFMNEMALIGKSPTEDERLCVWDNFNATPAWFGCDAKKGAAVMFREISLPVGHQFRP